MYIHKYLLYPKWKGILTTRIIDLVKYTKSVIIIDYLFSMDNGVIYVGFVTKY